MPLEERRKNLMKTSPQWGDRPQAHHVRSSAREDPRLNESFDNEYDEKALALGDMNRVIEPSPNPSKCRISTSGWTLENLVQSGERFRQVPRILASSNKLSERIRESERKGIPLIIEGWHEHPDLDWPEDMFDIDNFNLNGSTDIDVRNVHDWSDKTLPLSEFLAKSRAAPTLACPDEKERLYGKDADCPKEWTKWLHEASGIPSSLLPNGPDNLLLNQPRSSHVETLMCYLGIGDTFTPCHKDLCASSGQNLMCYTENGGSSYWFMTNGSDAPKASVYFQQLNQELDHETYVITVEELAKAPFKIYIAEQKLGDLVLVPPRSCHQVVNQGGLTVKTSWSRMTLKGLETAYYHELPIYRRVCRPEIYRVQSTIHYTLLRMTAELESIVSHQSPGPHDVKVQSNELVTNTRKLLQLFDSILSDEYSPDNDQMQCLSTSPSPLATVSPAPSDTSLTTLVPHEKEKEGGYIPVTCDFCGADIFQSFFECRVCVDPQELQGHGEIMPGDGYVVCAGCYSEGRSCKCRNMDPMQCRLFEELLQHRKKACNALRSYTGDNSLLEELDLSSTMGTFKAGCQLQCVRKQKGVGLRTCTLPKGPNSHFVELASGLACKGCHSSKCYIHILKMYKIHAVEALLRQKADDTHQEYHTYHRTSKDKYNIESETFLFCQRKGHRPDIHQQRVHTALMYRSCKPLNSRQAAFGWYDVYVQIHQELDLAPEGFSDAVLVDKPSRPAPPPLATTHTNTPGHDTIVENAATTTATSSDQISTTSVPSLGKRKRCVLAFVELPPSRYKAATPKKSLAPLGAEKNNSVLEKVTPSIVGTHMNTSLNNQNPPTSEVHEPRRAQSAIPEAPEPARSPSFHKPNSSEDRRTPPIAPAPPQPPRKAQANKPPTGPASMQARSPGPSINLIDHERSHKHKRTRVTAEFEPTSTNALRKLRFNKRSVPRQHSQPRPESSGDQLARVFNASALHNHTINLNSDDLDEYMDEEIQYAHGRNATPRAPSHRQEHDDEVSKLREEVHLLRQQVMYLSHNQISYQPQSTPIEAIAPQILQVLQQIAHKPDCPQQHLAYWPHDYSNEEYPVHLRNWRPEMYTPEAPRSQWSNQIPPKRYQNGYRSKPRARRHSNTSYPQGYHGYGSRPYEPRVSESHRPHVPKDPGGSGSGHMNERWKKNRSPPPRRLERLSYDRPPEVSQTDQVMGYPQSSPDTSNPSAAADATRLGTTPRVSNSREPPLEPRRSFSIEKRPGSQHENRLTEGPDSPSLESVSNELSANWEDEYEQDDPETPEKHTFKDSSIYMAKISLPPPLQGPLAPPTLDDPTLNPWN